MVEKRHSLCAVCAWRADCKKKFHISGQPGLRCVDFTRDITLKAPDETQKSLPKTKKGEEDEQ